MRIVVSGSHATGKSTLIADFLGVHPGFEHWGDPFELVDDSLDVPDAASYATQLDASARRLRAASDRLDVIVERGPLDFAAYLLALDEIGRGEHGRARALAESSLESAASAMRHVEVLALLPIEHRDRIGLGVDDDPELRAAMDRMLIELVEDGGVVASATRLVELTGDRGARLAALEAAVFAS